MKSQINTILFTFIMSFTLLGIAGCSDNKKQNNNLVTPVPTPQADHTSAQKFFAALQKAENDLSVQYGFQAWIQNGQTTYKEPSATYLRKLARQNGTPFFEFKAQYIEDVYIFATNYSVLISKEDNLRNYNNDLYKAYIQKTFKIGQDFEIKRINIYNSRFTNLEKNLKSSGIELFKVWSIGPTHVSLPIVKRRIALNSDHAKLKRSIRLASTVCSKLDALNALKSPFSTNKLGVSSCLPESSILYFMAKIPGLITNAPNLRINRLITKIKAYSLSKVDYLTEMTNVLLIENAIFIDRNTPRGIVGQRRRAWAQNIRNQNPGLVGPRLRQAFQNNLYENLVFRKKITRLMIWSDSAMTPAEKQMHEQAIQAVNNALSHVQYNVNLDFAMGTSPADGFVFQY